MTSPQDHYVSSKIEISYEDSAIFMILVKKKQLMFSRLKNNN